MHCVGLYCDMQDKEIGYLLEDCNIYIEEELVKLIRQKKIEVKNLELCENNKLLLVDTDEIKYESKARQKHAYGSFARALDSKFYIKLDTGERIRFLNMNLLKQYEDKDYNINISILEMEKDEKAKKFLSKAILMYGADSIKSVYLKSNGKEKECIYILKTDNHYNVMYVPNNIKVIESYILTETLKSLKGTLKLMGCEELENAVGLFRGVKNLEEIDLTTAKLNKLTDLSEMFYSTTVNTVRLGDLPENEKMDMSLVFSNCVINKIYLGKIKVLDFLDLNEAFSFSKIGELHMERLDTRDCIINIKHIFKKAKINFINAPNLSVKTSIDNYDILLNGNIYLPFLNCEIGVDGNGEIGTLEEYNAQDNKNIVFINNCTYLKQMYNRRKDERRNKESIS